MVAFLDVPSKTTKGCIVGIGDSDPYPGVIYGGIDTFPVLVTLRGPRLTRRDLSRADQHLSRDSNTKTYSVTASVAYSSVTTRGGATLSFMVNPDQVTEGDEYLTISARGRASNETIVTQLLVEDTSVAYLEN
jgi:hypothetical protein